jgi:hypothetical protein
MPAVLRTHLEAQYARTGTCMRVFADGRKPFAAPAVVVRAKKAWTALKLEGIGLHECRHAYASFMIAAGANAKSLSSTSGTRTSRSRWTATATSCPVTEPRGQNCSTRSSRRSAERLAVAHRVAHAASDQ